MIRTMIGLATALLFAASIAIAGKAQRVIGSGEARPIGFIKPGQYIDIPQTVPGALEEDFVIIAPIGLWPYPPSGGLVIWWEVTKGKVTFRIRNPTNRMLEALPFRWRVVR